MDSIEALIDRARAPDASLAMRQAAFSLIVERYQDAAYGYALATLGDPHLAWDAAQEAFLTAYCSLAELRSPQAFPGWLRRIVRTRCRPLRREHQPAMASLDAVDLEAFHMGHAPAVTSQLALPRTPSCHASHIESVGRVLPVVDRAGTVLDGGSPSTLQTGTPAVVIAPTCAQRASSSRAEGDEVTPSAPSASNHRFSSLAVPWQVLVVAGLMVAGLLVLSGAYGFHGDEMYYIVAGQHPAFGYVDQPPLTPLLSAASVALLGVSPTAVRVLPALEIGLIVVLVALIARDFGGSPRAQVLAALTAALGGYLGAGHLDTTTDPDLLAWAIILWLLVRLLAGADRRLWLAVGVVSGIGLENKDTLLFLGAGLVAGLVLTRRWDVVRLPRAWAALGIALLIWAPNLAWQATHGWPQITMARAIAAYGADNRAQILPLLWVFTGPLLFPVSVAGLAWVLWTKAGAPWRAIGIAAVVALVLVFISGGKGYTANEVGWPQFVATVEGVVATLPAEDRAHAVILTNDYSEASPLVLMGTALPLVYSGHNAFWDWGPPPADRTVVVHVGDWRPANWSSFFIGCRDVAHVDNGFGIENAEQGTAVSVCSGLRAPWTVLWPALRTIS